MKFLFFCLSFFILQTLSPAMAAEDDFGANFTAEAPAALVDSGMDFSAESLSTIAPAAGDSFLDPMEEAETIPGSEILAAPEKPLIPGMDAEDSSSDIPPSSPAKE